MRTAVLFHRFGPYHLARLRASARCLDLAAIELSEQTSEYAWDRVKDGDEFTRITLFRENRSATAREVTVRISTALAESHCQSVALPGWSDRAVFVTLHWCSTNSVPAVLMSESTAHDEPRVWWKEFIKRRIVNLYSTALVGGRLHREYLQQLGMPANRIFTGYDAVENSHFARKPNRPPPSDLPFTGPYFLASARFIEKKNLPTLLRAYARYRELATAHRSPSTVLWNLVLLGDGPLRPVLCQLLTEHRLTDCVALPGFKQYDELPGWYAGASAFVHASTTEQWGLVVNEAAAAGLPLLVSNRCGCVPELVHEGVNGFTFDPLDVEQLAQLMLRLSAFNFPLSAFGDASRRVVADLGPERFAQGLKAAAECALKVGPKRVGLFDRLLLNSLIRR